MRSESELEYALSCLRKVEQHFTDEISEVKRRLDHLTRSGDDRNDAIHDELSCCMESLESLRGAVQDLTSAIVRHIEGDSDRQSRQFTVDLQHQAQISKLSQDFATLAEKRGGSSGAAAGRQAAKRWAAVWSGVGIALSMIASAALQRCTADIAKLQPQQSVQPQTHGGP